MEFKDLEAGIKKTEKPTPEELPPEETPKELSYIKIRSRVLDEEIVILKAREKLKEAKKAYPGVVIYLKEEIDKLMKFKGDKKAIKAVHLAKKKFEGWIY